MTDRPDDDDDRARTSPESEDDDQLFAAAAAAVGGPARPAHEAPEPEAEAESEVEPEPEPEEDFRPPLSSYDAMFGPAPAAEPTPEPEAEVDAEPEPEPAGETATFAAAPPAPDDASDDGSGDSTPDDSSDAEDDEGGSSHRGRKVLLGAVVVLGLLYVGGYFATGLRLPANASVAGVDVSGMSPASARDLLTEELTPRTERPITLVEGETEFTFEPADAGLSLDVPQSVVDAGGERSWDPRDMVALLFGTHDHDAAIDAESSKFSGVLGTIGEKVDVDVVEAQISFPDEKPEPREPKAGRVVDKAATGEVIRDAYVGDGEPQEVVMKTVEPAVDQAGLDEAMDGIAQTAVSDPVAIVVGDDELELPVSAYAPALLIRVEDGAMTPYIDPEKLAKPLSDSTTGIGEKAVDATVRISDGKPEVVEGKSGVGLQPEEMATKLLPAIAASGDERSVSIEAKVVEPAFTTEDAENLKITEKISDFQTQYPPAAYRDTNQGRAAELINGTIVKPGETFSFNDTVGERTQANGFVTGTVINGGVFREELGGGVSQVVTTLYNAAFFGAMDDVEHHPHAFYIDRYPVGREATVYYGSLDLRFKNSSDYGVLIRAWVDKSGPGRNGRMNVELWSTKVYDVEAGASARRNFRSPGTQYDDSDRCVAQSPTQGFDIDIYRTFFKDGKKVKSETDTAVYQAADRVVCGKKPDDD